MKCLQREYSLLKRRNNDSSFFKKNHARRLHCLGRNAQALSFLLRRHGFYTEANLAREAAAQIRLFSTSTTKTCKKNDESDKEKHNDDQDDSDDKDKNKDEKEAVEQIINVLARMAIVFMILGWFFIYTQKFSDQRGGQNTQKTVLSWKEFYNDLLLNGEVHKILIRPDGAALVQLYPGAVLKGQPLYREVFMLNLPEGDSHTGRLEEKIREAEKELGISPENAVSIDYERVFDYGWVNLAFLLLFAYLIYQASKKPMNISGGGMLDSIRKANFTRVDMKSKKGNLVTFKDVAGLHEAKVEVMEFVDYLKNPQRYKELGAKIPRGSLLLGPPGCGKTLLAKAVAAEAQVPFLAMAGSEFVEMLGGLGASRVRNLFKEARNSAPCIIYIDEIDAIGRKRGGAMGNSEEEHTLNQLLVEMDGMGTTEGVIMLASTNRADVLDKALLRPGRFDRHIMIDLPTLAERKETFAMYLKKLKLKGGEMVIAEKLSHLTPGMSGADIANICNEAALHAARDQKKHLDTADFDYAVERVIAGVAKKSSVLGPEERKIVAYHESGHALVGWMLKETDALLRISIVPRTSSALGFAQYTPKDNKLFTTEQLFEKMCMALGGRVAESLVFNRVTTGAQDDLRKVTALAYNQIRSYGMNERVGYISFPEKTRGEFGTKPYSKKLAAVIDEEARNLVAQAYKNTENILKDNLDKLQVLAQTLLEKEVLTYSEVEKLIGPPPHGEKNKIDIMDPGMENYISNLESENDQPPRASNAEQ